MTRDEAIELAASALWANGNARYMATVRYMKWPEPDPLPTWENCDDTSRSTYLEEAASVVDALLGAGLTFKDDWEQVGTLLDPAVYGQGYQPFTLTKVAKEGEGQTRVFAYRPREPK